MNAVKKYTELHKQLLRKEHNFSLEVLFLTWSYISANKKFSLPEYLSIRHWTTSIYSNKGGLDLRNIFDQIDSRIPQLKQAFVRLFDAHSSRYRQGEIVMDLDIYASAFNLFEYDNVTQSEWHQILSLVIEDVVKKQKQLLSDPLDISRLCASIFSHYYLKTATKPKDHHTLFIPSLTVGTLAIEIAERTNNKLRFVAFESQLEAFCLSVFSFLIAGIDTSGVNFGEIEDFRKVEWDYFISFFRSSWIDDVIELEKNMKVIAFNAEIGIAIINQSFLFSNRYTNIRRHLINDSNLTSIVTLLPSANSNVRAKSAMLVFNKRTSADHILLVNGENLKIDNKRGVKYEAKEIDYLTRVICNQEEKEGLSKLFDVRDLRTDNYSLLVSNRLRDDKNGVSIRDLQKRILKNEQKLMTAELRLKELFNKIPLK